MIVLGGLAAAAVAQVLPVGTVDGTVQDSSGGAVPGMTITLTQIETNQVRTATTNDGGYYFFPLVNPGRYQVLAEKVGFKRSTQQVLVETGKRSTADFALELGQVTESVQVTAQAALLETSTASVSRNVQQRVVQDLPLLGRNPLMLINLAPGITNNSTTSSTWPDRYRQRLLHLGLRCQPAPERVPDGRHSQQRLRPRGLHSERR